MLYVVKKGNRFEGPYAMRSRWNGVRAWHTLSDEKRAEYGWYRLEIEPNSYDALRHHRSSLTGFDLVDGVVKAKYIITDKTLFEVKRDHRERLKESRDENLPTVINNVQVSRLEDRENIKGTLDSFEVLATDGKIKWVMADNSIAELTKEDLEEVTTQYATLKAQVFNWYSDKCTELENAENVDDVLAISTDLAPENPQE